MYERQLTSLDAHINVAAPRPLTQDSYVILSTMHSGKTRQLVAFTPKECRIHALNAEHYTTALQAVLADHASHEVTKLLATHPGLPIFTPPWDGVVLKLKSPCCRDCLVKPTCPVYDDTLLLPAANAFINFVRHVAREANDRLHNHGL